MNTLKDFNPPVAEPSQCEDDCPLVGVRINIPETPATALLWPSNNSVATEILHRLLRTCIEAAGIAVKGSGRALPFNSSLYFFDLAKRPAGPALVAVKAELEALGLLNFAQIAWRDHDEGIWRLYHPNLGVFRVPSSEEMGAYSRLLAETYESIKRAINGYGSA